MGGARGKVSAGASPSHSLASGPGLSSSGSALPASLAATQLGHLASFYEGGSESIRLGLPPLLGARLQGGSAQQSHIRLWHRTTSSAHQTPTSSPPSPPAGRDGLFSPKVSPLRGARLPLLPATLWGRSSWGSSHPCLSPLRQADFQSSEESEQVV